MKKNICNRICAAILAIVTVFLLIPVVMLPTFAETPKIWDGAVASGFASGTGAESDPYLIQTAEQLAYLAQSVNAGTTYSGQYIKLANNIVLNDTSDWGKWEISAPKNQWTTIGKYSCAFSGTFDGDGHTVSGMYINTTDSNQGLFGYCEDATLQKIGVERSYVNGTDNIGGVVGYSSATQGTTAIVTDCYNAGNVSGAFSVGGIVGGNHSHNRDTALVTNCYNTGNVRGMYDMVGGVVGDNESYSYSIVAVTNCCNTGIINGDGFVGGVVGRNYTKESGVAIVSNGHNTGAVNGGNDVGGVVGISYSNGLAGAVTVSNCHNTGNVNGIEAAVVGGVVGLSQTSDGKAMVSNCYNTGNVKGKYGSGGIVGDNSSYSGTASVSNCYNTGNVSGGNQIGGIAGSNCAYEGKYYVVGSSTIFDCYNIGTVSGTTSAIGESYVGGVVGNVYYGTTTNCYYLIGCAKDGGNTAQYGIGAKAEGQTTADNNGKTTGLADAQMKQKENFVGFDFETVWAIGKIEDYDYPTLQWQETIEFPKPHTHSYDSVVTPPTETERGYTTHTCSRCHDSYVDSYTDPIPAVTYGDINGDDTIDAFDYQMLKAFVLGTFKDVTNEQKEAMDVNHDGCADAFDYQMVKAHVLGTYVIQ